ncbi:MAG: hypothetical protein Q4D07_08685, partial [Selenomonadaceae bacterium]|nr:hypothetical protein [Selenomonadaceae bacterium]
MYGTDSSHAVPTEGVTGNVTTNSGDAVATGADFTVNGEASGLYHAIYGGHKADFSVENNTVKIKDEITLVAEGFTPKAVYGGYSNDDVENNIVIVENGAAITGDIYGGYSYGYGTVSGNNVYIYGNVTSDVYAGRSQTSTATGNTVTLGDKNDPTNKVSIGGSVVLNAIVSEATSGGTLNVYNSGHEVGGYLLSHHEDWLATGATINFYINSQDMDQAGSKTILSVNNMSYLDGVTINAGVRNAGSVKKGDKIVLIAINGGGASLYVDRDTKFNTMTPSDGIMKANLKIQLCGSGGTPVDGLVEANGKIIATALNDAEADLGPDSAAKSPVETMAASVSLINAGADMMAGEAMTGAAQSTAISAAEGS